MTTKRIAVFHYHLLPGGVTNVVYLSLKALIHNHHDLEEILLVTGTAENTGRVADKLQQEIDSTGRDIRLDVSVIPEIGYTTPEDAMKIDRDTLKARLLSGYGGYLWWVHNYHLGKNPVFTAALIEAAEEHPSQRMLFHIHDFPEDGRPRNLSFLQSIAGTDVYPVLQNVRYAVINSRDYRLLSTAGLPEASLFLLNDPLEPPVKTSGGPVDVGDRLEKAFAEDFPGYDPEKPLWLYPVRTIRRKNALEAALICSVAGKNLILTLPGVSRQERPYSDLIESLYRKGLIPGMWGIGTRLGNTDIDFPTLALSSDAVISSSVQEGFGYLYADAVRWGRPLVARHLEILDGIKDLFSGHPAVFYGKLEVPLETGDVRVLRKHYTRHFTGTPGDEGLASFLEDLSRGTADFASLHVKLQAEILERSKSREFRRSLRQLNQDLFTGIEGLSDTNGPTDPAVFTRFGPEAFSRTFEEIRDSYSGETGSVSGESSLQKNLLDLFYTSTPRYPLFRFEGL